MCVCAADICALMQVSLPLCSFDTYLPAHRVRRAARHFGRDEARAAKRAALRRVRPVRAGQPQVDELDDALVVGVVGLLLLGLLLLLLLLRVCSRICARCRRLVLPQVVARQPLGKQHVFGLYVPDIQSKRSKHLRA
jgi:hypothetical protein